MAKRKQTQLVPAERPVPSAGQIEGEIAALAYEYFLERGETPGGDVEDWLRAEREVRRRHGLDS